MRFFRLFLLILVGLTAVSCTFGSDNALPTQVPTAAVPLGPAGTNALNAPFQVVENAAAGLQIEAPADWEGRGLPDSIRLLPVPVNASSSAPILSTAVSVTNLPDSDPATGVTAVLASIIADPALAPPEAIEQVVVPTAVTINGYDGATAQIRVSPPDLTPVEGDPNVEGNEPLLVPQELYMYYVVLRHEDRTILINGTTDAATSDIYVPVFESIINTVTLVEIQE